MTKWLDRARYYERIGLEEIPGAGNNPDIVALMNSAGEAKWVTSDETPWCGGFMALVFFESGLAHVIPHIPVRAANWLMLPYVLVEPKVGAVAIFKRPGGHHVTLIVEITDTHLYCLGGNQGNKVCVKAFKRHLKNGEDAVLGYRWPVPVKTPKEMRGTSRIARRAHRQTGDAGRAGGALTTTQAPGAVPDGAGIGAIRESVDAALEHLTWLKAIATEAFDFLAFLGGAWPYVGLAIGVYFFGRFIWDSRLISKYRVADHNEGYSV